MKSLNSVFVCALLSFLITACVIQAMAAPLPIIIDFLGSECPLLVTVTSDSEETILVALSQGDAILVQADLLPGDHVDMTLQPGVVSYRLSANGPILFSTAQDCPAPTEELPSDPASPAAPIPDDYAALEAEFFAAMNWTQEEIDWFHNVYTPLYGNPEEYVLSQLELLKVLNQEP